MKPDLRVLIISFYFAPNTPVGGKRFSFITSYWQKKDCKIHVLTTKLNNSEKLDTTIPFGGAIHTARMCPKYPMTGNNLFFKLFSYLWCNLFCLIDPYSGWIIPAIKAGKKIIKKDKINVIIATGPPFSSVIIGVILKFLCNVNLVIDYRDPWSNHRRDFQKYYIKYLNNFAEKIAIKYAKALIFCTEMMKNNFLSTFENIPEKKCHVVYNGFQPVNSVEPLKLVGSPKIIYAGALYGDRRIELFVSPLVRLIENGIINRVSFRFHIFSDLKDSDKRIIQESSFANNFIEHTPLSHKKFIQAIKSADLLVLMISENMKYSVSYKFFDYLSSGKPILAIVPRNSEMDRIMTLMNCGRYAHIDDEESIYKNFQEILSTKMCYNPESFTEFHWNKITEKYFNIISTLN